MQAVTLPRCQEKYATRQAVCGSTPENKHIVTRRSVNDNEDCATSVTCGNLSQQHHYKGHEWVRY